MENVYLYFMDKESHEIISAEEGELYIPTTKEPKTTYVTTFSKEVNGSGHIYKVSINAGEVKDFKGSTVRLWLPKDDKIKAYKCFSAYFKKKYDEAIEKMNRLVEESCAKVIYENLKKTIEDKKNGDKTC